MSRTINELLDDYWQVSTDNCAAGIRSMENGWQYDETAEQSARQRIVDLFDRMSAAILRVYGGAPLSDDLECLFCTDNSQGQTAYSVNHNPDCIFAELTKNQTEDE